MKGEEAFDVALIENRNLGYSTKSNLKLSIQIAKQSLLPLLMKHIFTGSQEQI